MRHDAQFALATTLNIGHEGAAAADVIDVAMRVDNRVEARLWAPTPNGIDDTGATILIRRVKGDEPVIGFEQDRVRKCLDHRNAVTNLREFVVDPVDWPNGLSSLAFIDHRARQR
jgi:hypothetical protein